MKMRQICYAMLAPVVAFPMLCIGAQHQSTSHAAGAKAEAPVGAKGKKQTRSNSSTCSVVDQWVPSKLEENSGVLAAAGDFTRQLAGNYGYASASKKGPELTAKELTGGSEIGFVDHVILAAYPLRGEANATQSIAKCTAASTTGDTNKQTGAPSGSDGTTSTTELTGIPELLAIAVENGSVTNSISGSTMTLSTSLYGLFTGFSFIQDSSHNYDKCYICVRLGGSSTFNIANSTSPLSSASRKQVSQWQIKYSIFDQSTRSARVKDLWEGASLKDKNSSKDQTLLKKKKLSPQEAASELAASAMPDDNARTLAGYKALKDALDDYTQGNLTDIVDCIKLINATSTSSSASGSQNCSFVSAPDQWQPATAEGLANLMLGGLDTYIPFQIALGKMSRSDDFKLWAQKYRESLNAYNTAITAFESSVNDLSKGFNADVTFGQQFPTSTSSSSSSTTTPSLSRSIVRDASTTVSGTQMPDYLVGGVDLSWQPKTRHEAGNPDPSDSVTTTAPAGWVPNWTFNGNGSFYTQPNTALNEKTFRGVQTATQFQWTLGASSFVGHSDDKSRVTLALSGSYQRLPENRDQTGKRPDITSGSIKLTIPFPGGISFPLAMTYGDSQQQQAKGSYVIGNFGLSFDADKLASLLALKH